MKRVRQDMQTVRVPAALPLTRDRTETFAREVQATKVDLGRFAYLLVGNSTGADDLLSEAYARAWPHFQRGEIDNLPAYLRRSIANLANGRLRRIRLERRELATRRIDWRAPRTESPESAMNSESTPKMSSGEPSGHSRPTSGWSSCSVMPRTARRRRQPKSSASPSEP